MHLFRRLHHTGQCRFRFLPASRLQDAVRVHPQVSRWSHVLAFAATSPSHRPMGCAASGCRDAARRRRSQAVSRSVNLELHSARQDEGKTIQLLAEIFHYVIAFQRKLHFSTMRGKPSIWGGNAHDVIEISCA